MVSIPACHAGDRGSIPRRGGKLFSVFVVFLNFLLKHWIYLLFSPLMASWKPSPSNRPASNPKSGGGLGQLSKNCCCCCCCCCWIPPMPPWNGDAGKREKKSPWFFLKKWKIITFETIWKWLFLPEIRPPPPAPAKRAVPKKSNNRTKPDTKERLVARFPFLIRIWMAKTFTRYVWFS